ncbi:hypothetical protein, partial [Saccharothrix longispora]|uniref:hypothetical protein n=1 Tax=Saccharothrix longispora TaxID=33920 RepID=UPI0028FD489F
MRNMLTRAAEIRESEQQQIFDALDEIHARMSPLESLGSVRKRLSELPDRTEVSVLAERLDEALARLEAQDNAVQGIGRAVDGLVDKLAKPFAQLDGRLDGVAGRFEGVAGRMDGLEDKLSHIHKRIDDLDLHLDKQDTKVDQLPNAIVAPLRERIEALEVALRGRLDEVDEGVHEHLDGTREALQRSLTDSTNAIHGRIDETRDNINSTRDGLHSSLTETRDSLHSSLADTRSTVTGKLDEAREALHAALDETRDQVDATDRLEALAQRLEQVTSRLDTMTTRLDSVEDDFAARLGELSGVVEQGIAKVEGTLSSRPDADSLASLVRRSNQESELRIGGQLDEAMATFAELILGGGSPTPPPPPTALSLIHLWRGRRIERWRS